MPYCNFISFRSLKSVHVALSKLKGVPTQFQGSSKGTFFISLVCTIKVLCMPEPDNKYKYFTLILKLFVAQHLQASPTAMGIIMTSKHS